MPRAQGLNCPFSAGFAVYKQAAGLEEEPKGHNWIPVWNSANVGTGLPCNTTAWENERWKLVHKLIKTEIVEYGYEQIKHKKFNDKRDI